MDLFTTNQLIMAVGLQPSLQLPPRKSATHNCHLGQLPPGRLPPGSAGLTIVANVGIASGPRSFVLKLFSITQGLILEFI